MRKRLWRRGDQVWLRMHDRCYPAVITKWAGYAETHEDGYICQQYYADVTFKKETVKDGLVSHCMLRRREENGNGSQ